MQVHHSSKRNDPRGSSRELQRREEPTTVCCTVVNKTRFALHQSNLCCLLRSLRHRSVDIDPSIQKAANLYLPRKAKKLTLNSSRRDCSCGTAGCAATSTVTGFFSTTRVVLVASAAPAPLHTKSSSDSKLRTTRGRRIVVVVIMVASLFTVLLFTVARYVLASAGRDAAPLSLFRTRVPKFSSGFAVGRANIRMHHLERASRSVPILSKCSKFSQAGREAQNSRIPLTKLEIPFFPDAAWQKTRDRVSPLALCFFRRASTS